MHTLWAREHNKIAHRLAKINPNWSDETLYQEARRIVIAEIQFITYTEWLPLLLGKDYAEFAGLSNNNDRKYNPHDDPAVTNEAATAALRFVNSLKQGHIRYCFIRCQIILVNNFFFFAIVSTKVLN